MKPRFSHSNSSPRPNGFDARRERLPRPASCVALFDDRFIGWLMQRDSEPGLEPAVHRRPLARVLGRAAADAGLALGLRRIYWYTDRPDGQLVDDQIVRAVSGGETSQTWTLLDRDLRRLAASRAFESVLIACDDERIRDAIDEAQLGGLSVIMLSDDSLHDFAELVREEPEWAGLLAQADRRLIVRAEELTELNGAALETDSAAASVDGLDGGGSVIEEVVRGWWDSQTEESREDLRSALSLSNGIPQEVDRELLLQSRERFVRPLSLTEKRQMRDCLRVIATPAAG